MKTKRIISIAAVTTIVFSSFSPAAMAATSKKVKKEENVYVITDASGNVKKEIVTDTLKNTTKGDVISDTSHLKNIKNINGDEKFKKTGSTVKWKSSGKDITYEGTTDKTLPVDIDITYYLDGEEIEPDALAGKSGDLKIEVNYSGNTTANVPFVAVSSFILNKENASHVKVTNAKAIEEGDSIIIVGYGLPGLNNTIALDKIDIPSHFEVSAKVKDFKMDGMMSYVTDEVFQDVDLSDVNSVMDLTSSLNKLSQASTQLVDGSNELYKGITTLINKSGTLTTGVNKLNNGAKELADGTKQIKTGAKQIETGAKTLSDNIDTLSNGLQTANNGTKALQAGLKQTGTGIGSATDGISTINTGLKTAKGGLDQTIEGNKQYAAKLNEIAGQLEAAGQTETAAGLRQISDGLDGVAAKQSEISTGLGSAVAGTASDSQLVQGLNQASYACLKTTDNYDKTLMDAAVALDKGTESAYEGSKKLKTEGSDKLAAGADTLITQGIDPLVKGSEDLSDGLSTLQKGSGQLIDGIEKLQKGSKKLKNGMAQFDEEGIQKLVGMAGNIDNLKNRLNSSITQAKNYNNFAGKASNMSGTVKFVYKTDSIEK